MSNENLLSIIVPVYNVEIYIDDFLSDLYPQLNNNVEVVFINDGSLDRSVDIIFDKTEILPQHIKANIKIVNQSNAGVSMARNTGLALARGKFIAFLDPDDILEKNYIYEIIQSLNKHPEIDILSFEASAVSSNGNEILWSVNDSLPNGTYYKDIDFLTKVFKECSWQSWLRVIKNDLLKDMEFKKGIILEDIHFFVQLYLKDVSIMHTKHSLVKYRQREESAVHQTNQKIIDDYRTAIDFLKSFDKHRHFTDHSLKKIYLDYYSHVKNFSGLKKSIVLMYKEKPPIDVALKFIYFYFKQL
ncbi:glycosyltransferase [Acinetobacter rathckeae]|uniref:glycosyltransferase n=1 Tax=Acinetobacter rathckeae TaxID=2605272 RepID=UPI0018A30BED|nr:glycosyltransferase [Acinetobacter rathckeae]MBF7688990.1 glycosyltransferase [Acinetobacter rathckeae]